MAVVEQVVSTGSDGLRALVRGTYDLQKIRIQMGNRIVGNFKVKLGQEPSTSEEDMEEDAKVVLAAIRESYDLITDGVIDDIPTRKKFKAAGVIDTYTEFVLVAAYLRIEKDEEQHFRRFRGVLEDFPIWVEWMIDVRGVGPAMAAVIISEFDIHKAKYPSSFWAYAGLDVAKDGAGRSRRTEHLVKRQYIDKDGKEAERNSITFNPWLKTKLMGVLASSFVRAGAGKYEQIYRDYKHRLESNPAHDEKSKGHRDNMAKRYMVKMFLVDLHMEWRELEGLSVSVPYSEGKLGLRHDAR